VSVDTSGRSIRARVAVPADSQVTGQRPVSLALPSGAVLAVDTAVTVPGGSLTLPEAVDRAGWWEGGAKLGDPFGAIVIAAHVDSFADGIGPMAELLSADVGDVVRLASHGLSQSFEIRQSALVPRTGLARQATTLSFAGPPRLVLITCGGPYDRARGGYLDNLVIVAEPRGLPEGR